MKIIETIKSHFYLRVLLYLILIVLGSWMLLFAEPGPLHYLIGVYLVLFGLYYTVTDVLSKKNRMFFTPIASASGNIFWVVGSSILLIVALGIFGSIEDFNEWSPFFAAIVLVRVAREIRGKTLETNSALIRRRVFPYSTEIEWGDVDTVFSTQDAITIQAKNKDVIVVDKKKCTDREKTKIESLLVKWTADRTIVRCTVVIAALFGVFGNAYACKCADSVTIRQAYSASDLIAYGIVSDIDTVKLSETVAGEEAKRIVDELRGDERRLRIFKQMPVLRVVLKIVEAYKTSSHASEVIIYTPLRSASCGYRFTLNRSYIVYASRSNFLAFMFREGNETTVSGNPNEFWTTHCTRTAEYSQLESEELKRLKG